MTIRKKKLPVEIGADLSLFKGSLKYLSPLTTHLLVAINSLVMTFMGLDTQVQTKTALVKKGITLDNSKKRVKRILVNKWKEIQNETLYTILGKITKTQDEVQGVEIIKYCI